MKGRNITTKLLLLAFTLLSSNLWAQVTAEFTSNVTSGCSLPFAVQFTDQSTTVGGTINLRNWDFGNGTTSSATNPTATYTQPGVYNVMLIVRNTLNQRDTIFKIAYINLSGAMTVTAAATNATCYNCADGSIDLTVSGGTPPYTYLWSNSLITQDQAALNPGTYTVTVTDNAGCTATLSKTVAVICTPITVGVSFNGTILCDGDVANGVLRSTVSGGRGPYAYYWGLPSTGGPPPPLPGPGDDSLTGLTVGFYTLIVYDQDGCSGNAGITLNDPLPITVSGVVTNTTCGACADGVIDVQAYGGVGAFTYTWSNSASTSAIQNLARGPYTVTVVDGNGCTGTASFVVDSACAHVTTEVINNVSCFGGNDGSITVTTTGATGQATYLWSVGATTTSITNLQVGTYTLTVVDGTGCRAEYTYLIHEPNALSVTSTVTNASCLGCSDGTIDVFAGGGTAPYTFGINGGPLQSSSLFSGLSAGTYYIAIQDANGCSLADTVIVYEPCTHTTTINSQTNVSCHGGSDGQIILTTTGGSAPYTYWWSNTSTLHLNNVVAGTYTVTVTDNSGCAKVYSFTITEPAPIQITQTVTNATCYTCPDGAVDITVTGGTAPYTYLWSVGSTTEDLLGVLPGNYSVTVTDANGCTAIEATTVGGPCTVDATISTTDVTCFGGNTGLAVAGPFGGLAPYTYLWSNLSTASSAPGLTAGTYTVTITDAVGCSVVKTVIINQPPQIQITNVITGSTCHTCPDGAIDITVTGGISPYTYMWSQASVTEDIDLLVPGTYSVTVTDVNGCSASQTYTVAVQCLLTVTTTTTDVTCFGNNDGTATVLPTGGTGPYVYQFSDGSMSNPTTGLWPGLYSVTVTDAFGCYAGDTFIITEPTAMQITGVPTDASCATCNDGEIAITVSGGTPPYTYLWSNFVAFDDLMVLFPGVYTIVVTDVNGCTATDTYTVGPAPCNLTVDLGNDTAVCLGSYDIIPVVSGGTQPYIFSWSNGTSGPTTTISSAGNFTLTVSDNNGCTATGGITITHGSAAAMVSGDTTICSGGSASLWASGGNSYSWSPVTGLSNPTSASTWATPTVTTDYIVEVDNGSCITQVHLLVTVDNTCTWPGDADNSGLADNDDVLAIGIGYGDTGPLRNLPSLVWEGQNGPLWTNSLISGSNYKYIDTDGNGTIDDNDTLAINLNYGLTHVKTEEDRESSVPSIFIVLPDSVEAGQTVQGQIYFGTDSFPLTNVYGVKFSMNYNPDFVAENTVSFNFGPSWMGTPGVDLLTFQKDLHSSGRIDGAVTGINHVNRSGFGLLGTANFTMKDDISGKDLITESLLFSFTNVRAIDINEAEVDVTGEETTIIATQLVGIGQVNNTLPVAVYPNPAMDVLYINTYNQPVQSITMHNVLGMAFELPTTIQNGIYKLDTGHLPSGVYMVTIQSGESVATKRIVLNR